MPDPELTRDLSDIAIRIDDCLEKGRQLQPISLSRTGFDLADAYRVNAHILVRRQARGWRPVGRKIGFTNRTIWPAYGVDRAMWSYVYNRTVKVLEDSATPIRLPTMSEPRIEPEIVFGLKTPPAPEMTDPQILDCIEWIAQGFEIVQSVYPGWKFALADTIAAAGLHGALFIGPKQKNATAENSAHDLEAFSIELLKSNEAIDQGTASNVLGGPLHALRHLAEVITDDTNAPPLKAGEIITTGTLTDAHPIEAGQTWRTRVSGLTIPDIELTLG